MDAAKNPMCTGQSPHTHNKELSNSNCQHCRCWEILFSRDQKSEMVLKGIYIKNVLPARSLVLANEPVTSSKAAD